MRIEPEVEGPLRRSLAAVVDKNADGVLPPLESLAEERAGLAAGYASIVVGYVMRDVFEGDVDTEAVEIVATKLVQRESEWVEVGTEAQVGALLLACANGGPMPDGLGSEDPLMFVLVVAGYLLAWYSPEAIGWFEYLDRIWDYAESLPDPAP